jgi:hypothetical protein
MGNSMYIHETTVIQVYKDSAFDIYIVKTTPTGTLRLREDATNFIKIYNKLKLWTTHKFICDGSTIVDVEPCDTHYTCGVVLGFIDISIEFPKVPNYHQIIIKDKLNDHRILIETNKMKNIIINKTYGIHYEKAFGSTLYRVTKYESCGELMDPCDH